MLIPNLLRFIILSSAVTKQSVVYKNILKCFKIKKKDFYVSPDPYTYELQLIWHLLKSPLQYIYLYMLEYDYEYDHDYENDSFRKSLLDRHIKSLM